MLNKCHSILLYFWFLLSPLMSIAQYSGGGGKGEATYSFGGLLTGNQEIKEIAIITQPPAVVQPNQIFSIQLTLKDTFGNLVITSSLVEIAIENNPGSSLLSGTTLITSDNGYANFNDLSLNNIGIGYTLIGIASSVNFTSANFHVYSIYGGGGGSGDEASSRITTGLDGIYFNGITSDFSSPSNWNTGIFPAAHHTAEIRSGGIQPILSGSQTIESGANILIQPDASLSVMPNGVLVVHGTVNVMNNGSLILKSDGSGTGTIGNSTGSIVGSVKVERFIPGGRRAFRFLGHPFSSSIKLNQLIPYIHITGNGGGLNGFDPTSTNNPSAFKFVESNYTGVNNSGWSPFTNVSAEGNEIESLQPIRILYRGPRSQGNELLNNSAITPFSCTLNWIGPLNQGNINKLITYSGSNPTFAGWNLLSNPYASNIEMSSIAAIDRNNINNFVVWNPNIATKGAYQTESFLSSYVLPQGGAFFVKTNSSATFNFKESNKTINPATASPGLFKNQIKSFSIQLVSDTSYFWDSWTLLDNPLASQNFDDWDAPKMVNPEINIYSQLNTEKVAIDNRPLTSENRINLYLDVPINYHFSFKVNQNNMLDKSIYLIDNYSNTQTLMAQGSYYHFSTNEDVDSKSLNRFKLLIRSNSSGSLEQGLNHVEDIVCFPNPAGYNLTIKLNELLQQEFFDYRIINMEGATVLEGSHKEIGQTQFQIPVQQLKEGVYIILITSELHHYEKKFMR